MNIKNKRNIQTSEAIRVRKLVNLTPEIDKTAYVNEVRKLSPAKPSSKSSPFAIIPNSLGKSEKFLEKLKVLEALSHLNFIKTLNQSPKRKQKLLQSTPTESPFLPNPTHLYYRKVITPYSSGVVRVKSQSKFKFSKSPSRPLIKSRVLSIKQRIYEDHSFSPEKPTSETGYFEKTFANQDWYKGQLRKSLKHGKGVYHYAEFGLTFTGSFHRDFPDGYGTLQFASGHRIDGLFSDGVLEDTISSITYSDYSTYEGEILQGQRHGSGILRYPDSTTFKGTWEKDLRSNKGTFTNPNFFFEGFFSAGHTDGPGVLVFHNQFPPIFSTQSSTTSSELFTNPKDFPDFHSLTTNNSDLIFATLPKSNPKLPKSLKPFESGNFLSGKLNGVGQVKYGSLGEYFGEFRDGKRHGFGVMKYTDPEHVCEWFNETEGIYTGEWKEDKRHGLGTMVWSSGNTYEGMFVNDRRHGVTGKLTFINGDFYTGGFVNDNMVNPSLITKSPNS